MKRDLCYFYPCHMTDVYNAFIQSANQKFGKECKGEPPYTISFALNFSMKYNMNGGAVTIRLMPWQNGTAVNLRYSIAQAMGARYGAHARDLTTYVDSILGVRSSTANIDVNEFMAYESDAKQGYAAQPQQTPPQVYNQQPVYSQPVQQPVYNQPMYSQPVYPQQAPQQMYAQQPAYVQQVSQQAMMIAEKYRELYELGAITAEEYELRRKQWIGY